MPTTVIDVVPVLRRHLPTSSVTESDADETPGLWNERAGRPSVRVECASAEDVQSAVRITADQGLSATVWGGRRDVYARNAGRDQVVVDLRRMQHVRFHAESATVTAQGGTTAGGLIDNLPSDHVVVTPSNARVGIVGAGLGGGYGPLAMRYGLVCDQLRRRRSWLLTDRSLTRPTAATGNCFGACAGAAPVLAS